MQQLSKFLTVLFIKVLLFTLFILPSDAVAQRRSTSVNVERGGKTTISISNGFGNKFHIEYKGTFTLSDDDSDVVSISNGGYMEIKKSAFGNRRKITIEPDGSGGLMKKYYVGGSQRSFDAEGKKWLSEILLEVVRTTTLGAEKRVDRMYRKGGSYKVLKEVDNIPSDHVKARYVKLLLQKSLKEKDLIAVLDRVGNDFDSDHHKANILKTNTEQFLAGADVTTAFIKAASTIDSDHHTASVLLKALKDGSLTDTQLKTVFAVAKNIGSDHHLASVLLEVVNQGKLDSNSAKLLLTTSGSINSDHHKASVLKKAIGVPGLTASTYHTLLDEMDAMDSDHHMASILTTLVKKDLDSETKSHLLDVVGDNMTSDYHQANVLVQLAREHAVENCLPTYLSALSGIDSDHHKAEVFKQLTRKDFDEARLGVILEKIRVIDSDYHQANTLLSFAPMVSNGTESLKKVYREACMQIDSDSHSGRALKAVN